MVLVLEDDEEILQPVARHLDVLYQDAQLGAEGLLDGPR
jgi:hypothetical protein